MASNLYENVLASLYGYTADFSAKMVTAGVISTPLTQYNFDAYSEQNTLPAGDFIGIRNYSLRIVDDELVMVTVHFGLSTVNDENLFRLTKLTGNLMTRLLPKMKIPVFDTDPPNSLIGQLILSDGTDASPVYQAQQRPLRFIAVSAGLSRSMRPT